MSEKKYFTESPAIEHINKAVDVIIAGVLWFIFSIPIITIGPATCALYYTIVKSVRRDQGYVFKEFLHSFKCNLLQGIIINIVILIFCIPLVLEFPFIVQAVYSMKADNPSMFVLFFAEAAVLIGISCWIYPLLSRFEMKTFHLFKNAVLLGIRYFRVTIGAIAVGFIGLFAVFYNFLFILIVPGIGTYLLSLMIEPVFKKVCEKQGIEGDDWYLEG